jgi:hypothetical protein
MRNSVNSIGHGIIFNTRLGTRLLPITKEPPSEVMHRLRENGNKLTEEYFVTICESMIQFRYPCQSCTKEDELK